MKCGKRNWNIASQSAVWTLNEATVGVFLQICLGQDFCQWNSVWVDLIWSAFLAIWNNSVFKLSVNSVSRCLSDIVSSLIHPEFTFSTSLKLSARFTSELVGMYLEWVSTKFIYSNSYASVIFFYLIFWQNLKRYPKPLSQLLWNWYRNTSEDP